MLSLLDHTRERQPCNSEREARGSATFAEQTCDEAKRNMVTHVMINDPCVGYGIFIENMLNTAQMPEARVS